jgi:hypothetical protein
VEVRATSPELAQLDRLERAAERLTNLLGVEIFADLNAQGEHEASWLANQTRRNGA